MLASHYLETPLARGMLDLDTPRSVEIKARRKARQQQHLFTSCQSSGHEFVILPRPEAADKSAACRQHGREQVLRCRRGGGGSHWMSNSQVARSAILNSFPGAWAGAVSPWNSEVIGRSVFSLWQLPAAMLRRCGGFGQKCVKHSAAAHSQSRNIVR